MGMNARFCSQCGRQARFEGMPLGHTRLRRDMQNKRVAGVCAGLARYLNTDVTLIRIILLTLALGFGTGVVAYIIAWIAMPKDIDVVAGPPPAPVGPPPVQG
jgi:phage shock protein C